MREQIAIGISVITIAMLGALALVFACSQGSPSPPDAAETPAAPPDTAPAVSGPASAVAGQAADSARGYAVFREQTCERCHSVAGVGSPRYPLDGVGAHRTPAELRAWTISDHTVADSLSPSAARAKRRYAELPPAAMDALLRFLASLRRPR